MELFHFHHCKRHLKKRTNALDPLPPPAYAVYARENDDNYGRPLTWTGNDEINLENDVVVLGLNASVK